MKNGNGKKNAYSREIKNELSFFTIIYSVVELLHKSARAFVVVHHTTEPHSESPNPVFIQLVTPQINGRKAVLSRSFSRHQIFWNFLNRKKRVVKKHYTRIYSWLYALYIIIIIIMYTSEGKKCKNKKKNKTMAKWKCLKLIQCERLTVERKSVGIIMIIIIV